MSSSTHEKDSTQSYEDLLNSEPSREKPKLTKTGKILLGITGASFGLVFAVTTPFVAPALRKICLPYVPATTKQVDNVLHLLKGKSGRLIDLGSGDGRIVIEAAKFGFAGEGVELNPWLVWYSRLSSVRHKTSTKTRFYTQDLWKTDLRQYDHIVVFGVECMMKDLETKLSSELSPSSQIIVCRFPLPSLTPVRTVGHGVDTVWLYTRQSIDRVYQPQTDASTQ